MLQPGRSVRSARFGDLPVVLNIYAAARRLMAANGNPTQWSNRYPLVSTVKDDIERGHMMLLVDHEGAREQVLAQFAACEGGEPYYERIEGSWLDDDEYATMHRIAASGLGRRSAYDCLTWMLLTYCNVRVDTHSNNHAMQHVLASCGFTRCGAVTLPDRHEDAVRIAYQRHLK